MKRILLLVLMSLVLVSSHASAENGNPWYYSSEEVTKLYELHYNREGRLDNYIHEKSGDKYIARTSLGKRIEVPEVFIQYMLSHLETALEKGWVRYIFWPDLNHGHLFILKKLWEEKYVDDPRYYVNDMLSQILEEDLAHMGILYHAAEHFCLLDPANAEYIRTRNVVGWFDGRPIELTYPDPETARPAHVKANTAEDPEGYDRKAFISVSASKDGYFAIHPNGKEVRLDISFDENDIHDSTTYPRKKSKSGGYML